MLRSLTSSEAQDLLSSHTIQQIQHIFELKKRPYDDLILKTVYFGNLCAKGDIDQIKVIISNTVPEELETVLNNQCPYLWGGTCLHITAYWNTGDKALAMFELLVNHGAKMFKDSYGQFPWFKSGYLWITIIEDINLGQRDPEEFNATQERLKAIYKSPVAP